MATKKHKKKEIFSIKNLQVDNEVTGSCLIVECDNRTILIHYGCHQDNSVQLDKVYDINKQKMKIPMNKLTDVFILEQHYDHNGMLPVLFRDDVEFNGICYSTEPTAELSRLILLDSAHIMASETERYNNFHKDKKLKPLYGKEEVEKCISNIRCYGYEQKVKITDNLTFEFLPNKHLLGSAMLHLVYDDGKDVRRLLVTSDYYYGDTDKPFTKSILDKCIKADAIVTESTYGGRHHPKENPIDVLEKIIEDYVVGKNKILFIPTFAQGRSSALYYMLDTIYKRNKLIANANIPVWFCSNLLNECHKVYGKPQYECYMDEKWHGMTHLFNGQCNFKVITSGMDVDTFILKGNSRKIVVASSGMISGGFSNMIAKRWVSNGNVVCVGTGYQGEGTLGFEFSKNQEYVMVDGEQRRQRMKYLGILPNMSSHSDTNGLVGFIKSCNQHILKKVLIQHGGEEERKALKEILEKELNSKIEVKIFNQFDKVKF